MIKITPFIYVYIYSKREREREREREGEKKGESNIMTLLNLLFL